MKQAIGAYRHVTATDEFKELERLRSRARHNEASALGKARRDEREKWQGVVTNLRDEVADNKVTIEEQATEIARLREQLKKRT